MGLTQRSLKTCWAKAHPSCGFIEISDNSVWEWSASEGSEKQPISKTRCKNLFGAVSGELC